MDYVLRIDPVARELALEATFEHAGGGDLALAVATWVPGAYAFMRYGRGLYDVAARDAETGAPLAVERAGFSGFSVKASPRRVRFTARIVSADPAWGELVGFVEREVAVVRATPLPFVVGYAGPVTFRLVAPEGWAVHATGGERRGEALHFRDFAALLDAPTVCGRYDLVTREVAGRPIHTLFLARALGFEREHGPFVDELMRVTEKTSEALGALPFDAYTFIVATDPRHSFGLEFGNATLIGVGDDVFIDAEARRTALRLAAHELVHAWNVCRLRPRALLRPDLVAGAFPDGLWLAEGFTRYYELLLATRAGAHDAARLISNLVRYDEAVRALPAARHVSLVDSSRATFLNHNRFPGSASATLDYYDKGLLVAFVLDAALRTAKKPSSLDEAFRAFYAAFVAEGFATSDAISFLDAWGEKCGVAARLGPLLEATVVGSSMPDVTAALAALGVDLERRRVPTLGVWLKVDRGPLVTEVAADSPAAAAGILAGDELVAQGGYAFRVDGLRYLIGRGEPFALTLRRGHRELSLTVSPQSREKVSAAKLARKDDALLSAWLGEATAALAVGAPISLSHYDNFHVSESML